MAFALVGETGIGKTYNTYHIIDEYPDRCALLIRSLEDLAQYHYGIHTDIIFDDISFELSRPELLIHLTDKDFDAPVRILRQVIHVEAEATKWFTHNNESAYQPLLASYDQQRAIDRRLQIFFPNSKKEVISIIKKILKNGRRH